MRNRFQTLHVVLNILGALFIFLAGFLVIPLAVVLFSGEIDLGSKTCLAFILPSALSFLLGILFRALFRGGNPSSLQALLVCSLGWLGFSAIGALPFVIAVDSSYMNGFFEAMSGFTTTGITMFTGLDQMPRSILFWRSLTEWVGGLGILTFFLAVTCQRSGAHRLFSAESYKIGIERPVPGLAHTLKVLWGIYAVFTLLITIGLAAAGMSFFDSICHGLTTFSTGGFSTHDASVGFYRLSGHPNVIWIEYILIEGMILGGTNFLIHYRSMKRDLK
ncbi:MAG: TrkH family potassium uptake protein, partial [Candidatus Krumholzibacteria bacterium]|nr:TrkH family potassium uptake protein [Candidatus Krumholzibacteria bacterium]